MKSKIALILYALPFLFSCTMHRSTLDTLKKSHNSTGFRYLFFSADSVIEDVTHGYQNVEEGVPMNEHTSFHALSTTKTLSAVAVMQLVEQGKLKLDDPITKYIPTYNFSETVTVRQLLSHQSGIANPIPLRWTHPINDHANFNHRGFADSLVLGHLHLKRSPEKKYAYSNLNYLVLGRLIEEVSGMNYTQYIKEHILDPLSLEQYIGFDIPDTNHANGYHPNTWFQNLLLGTLLDKKKMTYAANKNWRAFHSFYINGASYGGLISTAPSLMEYCRALLRDNGPLLSTTVRKEMLTEQHLKNGKETGMCLGWFNGSINGVHYFCHAGGGGGYYVELRIYPKLGLGSVIMTNSTGMKDKRLLDKLDLPLLLRHN